MAKQRLKADIKARLGNDTAFQEAACFHMVISDRTLYEWLRTNFRKKLDAPAFVEFCERYVANHPVPIEQEA